MEDTQRVILMLESLRWEIRANTYAIRGTQNWDRKDAQAKVLRALEQADLYRNDARREDGDSLEELGRKLAASMRHPD